MTVAITSVEQRGPSLSIVACRDFGGKVAMASIARTDVALADGPCDKDHEHVTYTFGAEPPDDRAFDAWVRNCVREAYLLALLDTQVEQPAPLLDALLA